MSVEPSILEDAQALNAWIDRHGGHGPLGIDTEADGMFRYRARLCFVQLAAGEHVAIVDTLKVSVAHAAHALDARGPLKLLHDLAFDARLLAEHGVALGPAFDSSIAARFLGLPSTGLKALLASELSVELDKSMQQADWGVRPLPERALPYLADDVRHLAALGDRLRLRLRAAEIEPEVEVECAYALAEAQRPRSEPSPFARLTGSAALTPKVRARLYALANVREQLAEARDVPAGRFLPSGILLAAAQSGQIPSGAARFLVGDDERQTFARALAEGDAAADAPEHELARLFAPAPPVLVIKLHKARRTALLGFRERAATERTVDPQVVLPGHCLQAMLSLPELSAETLATVPGFGECRLTRYATRLFTEIAPVWHQS